MSPGGQKEMIQISFDPPGQSIFGFSPVAVAALSSFLGLFYHGLGDRCVALRY
jgi:hypothetical protein